MHTEDSRWNAYIVVYVGYFKALIVVHTFEVMTIAATCIEDSFEEFRRLYQSTFLDSFDVIYRTIITEVWRILCA